MSGRKMELREGSSMHSTLRYVGAGVGTRSGVG